MKIRIVLNTLIGHRSGTVSSVVFLDTNAVIWLYQGEIDKFPESLQRRLEQEDLFVSPFVKLELQYLYETNRIKVSGKEVLDYLYEKVGLILHNVPLNLLIEEAVKQKWTRDPFDRLIVSHAMLEGASLVTRDEGILANYQESLWE